MGGFRIACFVNVGGSKRQRWLKVKGVAAVNFETADAAAALAHAFAPEVDAKLEAPLTVLRMILTPLILIFGRHG
jgi:hypothetical protein